MKFPKRVRHKAQVVTIYGKSKSYPGYRVAWHVAGQRKLERFRPYGEAKRRADALVTQLAKGSNVTALSAKQRADALAAYERLQGFYQHRLVEIVPALDEWLQPFRSVTSGKVCPITAKSAEVIWQQQFLQLCELAKITRKTNGRRHSFCSFHFAAHANENPTAAQASNSPAMIHANYKGLATKAEATKWFAVAPAEAPANVLQLNSAAL